MKVLSLDQPYAHAVALGLKRFETRGWKTKHHGPLAIHATARKPRPCPDSAVLHFRRAGYEVDELPRGMIVATCQLVSCELITPELLSWAQGKFVGSELELGIWTPGRYAWSLAGVVRLAEPIPAKGRQRLWNFPREIIPIVLPIGARSCVSEARRAAHHCHARNCSVHTKPEMLMCARHWFMVPMALRRRVWATYRKGQCEDMRPSKEWHEAADAAIAAVFAIEQKKGAHAGLFDRRPRP